MQAEVERLRANNGRVGGDVTTALAALASGDGDDERGATRIVAKLAQQAQQAQRVLLVS